MLVWLRVEILEVVSTDNILGTFFFFWNFLYSHNQITTVIAKKKNNNYLISILINIQRSLIVS